MLKIYNFKTFSAAFLDELEKQLLKNIFEKFHALFLYWNDTFHQLINIYAKEFLQVYC